MLTLLPALLLSAQTGGAWETAPEFTGVYGADSFGSAIVTSVDVNQDGVEDLIIGARQASPGGAIHAGAIFAYSGTTRALLWTAYGGAAGDKFGTSLAPVDDVDGDGIPELVVGATRADSGSLLDVGQVSLVSGSDGALLLRIWGDTAHEEVGGSVVGLEDCNGDGVPDFAAGARISSHIPGLPNAGRVLVCSGTDGQIITTLHGASANAHYGSSLAYVGDTNSNGVQEIAVGVPSGHTPGVLYSGAVVIVEVPSGQIVRTIPGQAYGDGTGEALLSVPDYDGDGHGDLLITSLLADRPGLKHAGSVSLVSAATGSPIWTRIGSEPYMQLGRGLALAPDLDADGIQDFYVGGPARYSLGPPTIPRVLVLSGGSGDVLHGFVGPLDTSFGLTLASHGMLDGDSVPALLIADSSGQLVPTGVVHVKKFDPYLHANRLTLPAFSAELLHLKLRFPASDASMPYRVFASATGTGPTHTPTVAIPLTVDPPLQRQLGGWTPPGATAWAGTLDANGRALATLLSIPGAYAGLVGQAVYLAAVSFDPQSTNLRRSSAAVRIEFVP